MPLPVQRHSSTFGKGQVQDIHISLQPAGTYRQAAGWSLRFTPEQSLVLSVEELSKVVCELPDGFDLVGGILIPLNAGLSSRLMLFLCREETSPTGVIYSHSLFGVVNNNQFLSYYDDDNDPFGERLNLYPEYPLELRLERETANRTRVYVNDRLNPPRCINIEDTPSNLNATYPRTWSVHSFALQPDVRWGQVYYRELITGTQPTGYYRYSYRYYREGLVSAPFQLSTPLTLMENPATYGKTQMGASGITTKFGLRFQIDQPDRRWPSAELLVSYSPDGVNWSDMVVAERKAIDGETLTLDYINPSGMGITVALSTLSDYQQPINRAGAMVLHSHKLLLGDLSLGVPTQPVTKGATFSHITYNMPLDTAGYPTELSETGPLAGTPVGIPVTIPGQGSGNFPAAPLTESRYIKADGIPVGLLTPVGVDFTDYKGIQVSHRRVGLRSGERYPYAVVLFDRLGQPTYAWPLGIYAVPNSYDNASENFFPYAPTFGVAAGNTIQQVLRPKGVSISNLQLPYSVLYDEQGKLQVSGFAIVRGENSGTILSQGMALPAVLEDRGRDHHVVPLPEFRNVLSNTPENGRYVVQRDRIIPSSQQQYGQYMHLDGWVTYHSPELLTDGVIEESPVGLKLRLVGSFHPQLPGEQGVITLAGTRQHYYVKTYVYKGDNIRAAAINRPKVGDSTPVKYAYRTTTQQLEKFFPEDQELIYSRAIPNLEFAPPTETTQRGGKANLANGHYLLYVNGGSLLDRGLSNESPIGYAVVNLERPTETKNPLSVTYQWTNHYQPIDEAMLATLPSTIDEQGQKVFVVNGIDVWGGDTYLSNVGFARMLPTYDDDLQSDSDYAVAHFLPIESKYNLSLRQGRTYERVGTMPQSQARTGNKPSLSKGINNFQPEEWNLSKGLQITEFVRKFLSLPPDTRIERYWPQGIAWSKLKTDGEKFDSYRNLPASNLYLMEGEHGPVTGLASLFGQLYVGQARAFARVPVDERQLVQATSGETLRVADPTGREVGPADYITEAAGWQTWENHVVSPRSIYFLDDSQKKLFRFSQAGLDPISDRDGLHDFLQGRNILGFSGGFDKVSDTLHLLDASTRITYNEALNCFVGQHGTGDAIAPILTGDNNLYLGKANRLITVGRTDRTATLRFVVNPVPGQPKLFRTGILTASKELCDKLTLIKLRTATDTQTIAPPYDSRVRFREGRLWLPLRGLTSAEPMRGAELIVELYFDELTEGEPYWLLKWDTDYVITQRP